MFHISELNCGLLKPTTAGRLETRNAETSDEFEDGISTYSDLIGCKEVSGSR